jgi:transcriptional regulator with XRE-family HTH domain
MATNVTSFRLSADNGSAPLRRDPADTARRGARRADRTDAELGQRLWQLRLRRGITRREAAARLGVTAQQIQKYELGQDRLSIGRLVRLAGLLETPLPVLIDGLGEADGAEDSSADRARRHAESCALMRSFALLERDELREMVLTLAARLAALAERGEGEDPAAVGEFPGLAGPGFDRRRGPGGSTPVS